jgi:predicted ribosome quality control (RQC) complex YloA/Tae2 family protein
MPRSFLSPNGLTILVGKNKRDNDHVTFELGRPYDFWFHAEQLAGSHVILQWDPMLEEPTMDDFTCAANYAAFFSKGRMYSEVPVQLCRVCDVEKPKHGPVGRVQCLSSCVIYGKPHMYAKRIMSNHNE